MSKKRILIVDDDQDILRMLEFGLKKLGPEYEIHTARDIFGAMDVVEKYRFNLILTDYMMPGMTGVDLARAARRMSPDTQVVLMTAYGTSKLRHTTDHLGFDGYLNKPFTMDQLRDLVRDEEDQPQPPETNQSEPEPATQPEFQAPEPAEPEAPASVGGILQQLQVNVGTRAVLLLNSDGEAVETAGQVQRAKVASIGALAVENFYASTRLSTLIDNPTKFGATFYEGETYNLYVCEVNDNYLLAVIFDARLRPGAVWFYAKQAATDLAPLLT